MPCEPRIIEVGTIAPCPRKTFVEFRNVAGDPVAGGNLGVDMAHGGVRSEEGAAGIKGYGLDVIGMHYGKGAERCAGTAGVAPRLWNRNA